MNEWIEKDGMYFFMVEGKHLGSYWEDRDGCWRWWVGADLGKGIEPTKRRAELALVRCWEAEQNRADQLSVVIRELREIRGEIDNYFDALGRRRDVVLRARDQGMTWSQIGEALGISTQGARKILVK